MAGPFAGGSGTVANFDDRGGYGQVVDPDGQKWPFHCTAIADGTRTIEPGVEVRFDVVPGRLGRWEAVNLHPA